MDIVRSLFCLLRRLIVWGLVIGLGWAYFNNQQFQQTANGSIWRVEQRVTKLLGISQSPSATDKGPETGHDNHQAGSSSQSNNSDAATPVPTTGRWPSNQATIFVGTGNTTLDNAANSAIQAWNQTGAFTFKTTTDRKQADIVVRTMDNNTTDAAGLTETSSNQLTGRFTHADVYLNQRYLTDPAYGYTQGRIVNTAEHELGHAIGLDHTNRVSVMQPAGSFYPIQPADVQTVKQLYAE